MTQGSIEQTYFLMFPALSLTHFVSPAFRMISDTEKEGRA